MEIRLLGPLEVIGPDGPVTLGSRIRAGIAIYLALHAGRSVPAEVLLDAVWGEDEATAELNTLRYHISKLRDTLEPGRTKGASAPSILRTTEAGYVLDISPDDVDTDRFERLVTGAVRRLDEDPEASITMSEQALELWRGDPLVDVRYHHFAQAIIGRLQELWLQADLARLSAMVAIGREAEAIPELRDRSTANPHREDVTAVMMEALYRTGRHAEALQAATSLREDLGGTLGLDISPRIRDLEERILRHSPDLNVTVAQEAPNNLPAPHNRFFGRTEEITAVGDHLTRSRLVTLTGFGGIGKSRLGIEAAGHLANRFPQGTWLAELAPTRAPEAVATILAAAAGVDDPNPATALDEMLTHLRERCALLVIDNCEHVLDAVADVVRHLIRVCPDVSVLATSRIPLGVDGEALVPVGPLSAKDRDETAAMFADRAATMGVDLDPTAPNVAELCTKLGGIPLAIELAAAKLRVISLGELRAKLDSSFALLGAYATPEATRHPTLEVVLEWSYSACSPEERAFLEQISVFRGGFDLDAAAAVGDICSEDAINLLDGLVRHAFVGRAERHDTSRYSMVEAVADFSARKLDDPTRTLAGDRHAHHYIELVANSYGEIFGAEQAIWLDRLDPEIANIRAILSGGDTRQRAAMAAHSWRFFYVRDLLREAMGWLDAVDAEGEPDTTVRLRLLYGRGILAWYLGRIDESEDSMRSCLAVANEIGDSVTTLACRSALAQARYSAGDLVGCRAELETVLAMAEEDDPWRWCYTLAKLIYACRELGDDKAVETYAQMGNDHCVADDPFLRAEWMLAYGDAALGKGDLALARSTLSAVLALTEQHGFDAHRAWAHCALGHVNALDGDWAAATNHLRSALAGFRTISVIEGELEARAMLAVALARNGELALAQRLLAEEVGAPESVFVERRILNVEANAIVAWFAGDRTKAARNLDRARAMRVETSTVPRGALAPLLASLQPAAGVSG